MPRRLEEHGIMMGDRGQIFDRLDTNHDGSISRQEFMAGQPLVREQRVMILRDGSKGDAGMPAMDRMHEHMRAEGMGRGLNHLFEMADRNHDGRVTLAEAEAAALAHFDNADRNHDGKITPDEHQQMRQVIRMEHPRS
jgi:Ca2+-binding EF-hand superfamily protein